MEAVNENMKWLRSGQMGCTFGTVMARNPKSVNWDIVLASDYSGIKDDTFIQSIVFPRQTAPEVRAWALEHGFYVQDVTEMYEGLRIEIGGLVSWVQYFGPDSHVKTRQAPHAMLSFACKIPAKTYFKVGFNGILHIAHASVDKISKRNQDIMWETSHKSTAKIIGHKPTIAEAAKTTWKKEY